MNKTGALDREAVEERRAMFCWRFEDGRVADIVMLTYGHAMIAVMRPDPDPGCYDDVWYYHSLHKADVALTAWDGEGEPTGWYRHPATGRRRTDGDPSKEYVLE